MKAISQFWDTENNSVLENTVPRAKNSSHHQDPVIEEAATHSIFCHFIN